MAAGTGGTERRVWRGLGSPQAISESCGAGWGALPKPERRRPGTGKRFRHGPIEPWKNPGARGRGGPLPGTTGTKAARDRMQSWKNPSGRRGGGGRGGRGGGAARARQPCHPRGPAGAGLLSASAPQRSSRVEAEAGENKMPGGEGWAGDREPQPPRVGCRAPACSPSTSRALGRGGGWPHAGHTQHCTRPLGSCSSRRRPACRGRAHTRQWRGRVPRRAHCTHHRLHARAPRRVLGREKESLPSKGPK